MEYHDPNTLIDKSLYFDLWFHRAKSSEQTSKIASSIKVGRSGKLMVFIIHAYKNSREGIESYLSL